MKLLLVFLIAFVAFVSADEEWKPIINVDQFIKIHEDCKKEHGVTTEQNEKMLKGEYPDEKEVHEYVLCTGKAFGTFTEDKGYDLERMMKQLDAMFENSEKLRDMVTNCIDDNEQKSSPAEWAFRGKKCIMTTRIGEMVGLWKTAKLNMRTPWFGK